MGILRNSGGFINFYLAEGFTETSIHYEYMDLSMGTSATFRRADLFPFYEYIFQNLKQAGCDWQYDIPKLWPFDAKKVFGSSQGLEFTESGESSTDRGQEISYLNKNMENRFREKSEASIDEPLKKIVMAYKKVYGSLPKEIGKNDSEG